MAAEHCIQEGSAHTAESLPLRSVTADLKEQKNGRRESTELRSSCS
jgi:hypothetical protein